MRLISSDPMRDAVRQERVLRLLRAWPAGETLPSLAGFALRVGLGRGGVTPGAAEARLRAVLAGLDAAGRVRVMTYPQGWPVPAWLVQMPDGRVLRGAGVPAHWLHQVGAAVAA